MCSSPNLATVAYWHQSESQFISGSGNSNQFNTDDYFEDMKPILSKQHPFTVNNHKHEIIAALNKNSSNGSSDKMDTKSFFPTFQLTPEECNEILMKRAAAAAEMDHDDSGIQPDEKDSELLHADIKSCKPNVTMNFNLNSNIVSLHNAIKLRPYSCLECGKTFIQKHHLTTHTKVHSGVRPHSCVHCGKTFTHKHCLNTHMLLHSNDRPFQCTECKKSFTLKHHLLSHSKVHSRDKPFICEDCGQSFPLKRHLVTHIKFHAGERPFVCEDCGESFAQKDHLVMHARFHGSVDSFACTDCGATFSRKFELVNHSRMHGHLPLSCPICNKEFMQRRTLIVHMRYHTGETPFHCLICGEAFRIKSELTLHSKTHDPGVNPEDRLLSCPECGSSFNNPEALALHIKLHSGDTSFVNDLYTLTASLQNTNFPLPLNNFNNNLQTNNNANKTTAANNVTSNTSSNTNSPLIGTNAQILKVQTANNNVQIVTMKIKSHVCKFCEKAFSAKHGLQQHNRKHPDGSCTEKSHVCGTCNKAFYQKNHLLLHQRQHMDPNERNTTKTQVNSTKENGENRGGNKTPVSRSKVMFYAAPQLGTSSDSISLQEETQDSSDNFDDEENIKKSPLEYVTPIIENDHVVGVQNEICDDSGEQFDNNQTVFYSRQTSQHYSVQNSIYYKLKTVDGEEHDIESRNANVRNKCHIDELVRSQSV